MIGVGFAMLIFGLIYFAFYKFCKLMFVCTIKVIMLIPKMIRKVRMWGIRHENQKLRKEAAHAETER